MVSSVVKVLDETMNSVSAGSSSCDRLGQIGAVDVRNEAERHLALAVKAQCLVSHHRAEVEPPIPTFDHVADPLAGMAFPLAAAHLVAERAHLIEHGVDFGHDVFPSDHDGGVLRSPQSHVQHRTVP